MKIVTIVVTAMWDDGERGVAPNEESHIGAPVKRHRSDQAAFHKVPPVCVITKCFSWQSVDPIGKEQNVISTVISNAFTLWHKPP